MLTALRIMLQDVFIKLKSAAMPAKKKKKELNQEAKIPSKTF